MNNKNKMWNLDKTKIIKLISAIIVTVILTGCSKSNYSPRHTEEKDSGQTNLTSLYIDEKNQETKSAKQSSTTTYIDEHNQQKVSDQEDIILILNHLSNL
mgnify:CR=1 FL=1